MIDVVQKVVSEDGCSLLAEVGERRAGDPTVLVADATQAKQVLNWQPEYADLENIIRHAWAWEKKSTI